MNGDYSAAIAAMIGLVVVLPSLWATSFPDHLNLSLTLAEVKQCVIPFPITLPAPPESSDLVKIVWTLPVFALSCQISRLVQIRSDSRINSNSFLTKLMTTSIPAIATSTTNSTEPIHWTNFKRADSLMHVPPWVGLLIVVVKTTGRGIVHPNCSWSLVDGLRRLSHQNSLPFSPFLSDFVRRLADRRSA